MFSATASKDQNIHIDGVLKYVAKVGYTTNFAVPSTKSSLKGYAPMFYKLTDWLKVGYTRAVNSIAFYPAIISLCLGFLGLLAYTFRQNVLDQKLMDWAPFFDNADPESLRTLMNVVTVGSISISVFSFSMVMVVLSQAANTYSPKVLDGLIKNKKPQRILGFYIGTVVFCLPQLLLIGDDYERSISPTAVLLAVVLAIVNMFFFIEFIDYISRSVKPAEICRDIHKRVVRRLREEGDRLELKNGGKYSEEVVQNSGEDLVSVRAKRSGYFQGVDYQKLFDLCQKEQISVRLEQSMGGYILKNAPLFSYAGAEESPQLLEELHRHFVFHDIEDIEQNAFFGFRELSDITTKAMSPGVNDIGTARISVDLLIDLLGFFARCKIKRSIVNQHGELCILLKPYTFPMLVHHCLDEIRIYAKDDRSIVDCLLSGCAALLESLPEEREVQHEISTFVRRLLRDVENSTRLTADLEEIQTYVQQRVDPLLKDKK
jgi:uncharacterized membrane protein